MVIEAKICKTCKREYPIGTINYDLVDSTGLCLDCGIECQETE